jgi:response regulator RpfG family c-di-GMP phosphodiesterase
MMPEKDGGRVLADLRNDLSLRYIPVVLLTAIAREAQDLALTGGIRSTVVAKPVQLPDLLSIIESHLNANLTYNQLQEGAESGGQSQHHTPIIELPNFDDELSPGGAGLRPLSSGGGNRIETPSMAFSEHFPTRESAFPQPGDANPGSGFAFPGRDEEEKPTKPAW